MNHLKFSKTDSGNVNINKTIEENEDGILVYFDDRMSPKTFLGLNWRLTDYIIRNHNNENSLIVNRFVKFRFDSHFNTILESSSYVRNDDYDLQNWCFIENKETFDKIEGLLKNNQLPRMINTIPINRYNPDYIIPYVEDNLNHIRYGQLLIDDLISRTMGSKENLLIEIFLGMFVSNCENTTNNKKENPLTSKYSFDYNNDQLTHLISLSQIFFRAYTLVKRSSSFEEINQIVNQLKSLISQEKDRYNHDN